MSDYRIIHPQLGAIPVSQTDTVKRLELGYRAQAVDMASGTAATGSGNYGAAQFVYCVGFSTSAPGRGDLVVRLGNSLKKAGSGSTASNLPLGIAAGAVSGTNVYGWVMVKGICDWAKLEAATTDTLLAGGVAATAFIASTDDGLIATTQTAAGHAIVGMGFLGSVAVSGANSTMSTATISNMTVNLFYPQIMVGSAL